MNRDIVMNTDWNLIRDMLNAAVDACERIEATGFTPADRAATLDVHGQPVSVQDFLVSAWTLPENIRHQIIRDRHEAQVDQSYVPETARILTAMAEAAAELIGGAEAKPAETGIREMIDWYRDHATPGIEAAIAQSREAEL